MTAHSQSVTQAGSNSYVYDQNGNMTSRTVAGVAWTYSYNTGNQLTQVKKNDQLISEYGYDGDGNRVWAKDYEGYLAANPKVTTYIGDYYEVRVEGYIQPTGGTPSQPCIQTYCAYFPYVANIVQENISYYYADGQRIAMKINGTVSYLYGDQLGSLSAVADVYGNQISKTFYHPWGTVRYSQGTSPTDYAYTGQMKEGDIYFYNARWYDPQLGRFMQADTLVPPTQGTQAFDRYAYVNNNPLLYNDPTGHCVGPLLVVCFMVGTWIVENAAIITAIALTGAIVSYVGPSNPDPALINDPIAAQEVLDQANINALAWLTLGEVTLQFGQYYNFPQQPKYPPNEGFVGNPEPVTMQPGEKFDRIGSTSGVFGAEPGTPLPQRSLPPTNPGIPLRIYEVQKPITGVLKGITAPFYNQPGGGVQYKFPSSIEKMLNDGFIKELIK